jgi:hypothetical protein
MPLEDSDLKGRIDSTQRGAEAVLSASVLLFLLALVGAVIRSLVVGGWTTAGCAIALGLGLVVAAACLISTSSVT